MNKKVVVIAGAVVLALLMLVFIFYLRFSNNKKSSESAQTAISVITPTSAQEELATWTDPAEFSFQYSKDINMNPHEEDKVNYAHVELTSEAHPGNLVVWAKDTTVQTIDAWIAQQKITNAIDSTLDGLEAKKILATNEKNIATLSVLRNGYLYQIEVNSTDKDYWNKIFNQVVSTFKFNVSSGSRTAGADENIPDVLNDEEVIE